MRNRLTRSSRMFNTPISQPGSPDASAAKQGRNPNTTTSFQQVIASPDCAVGEGWKKDIIDDPRVLERRLPRPQPPTPPPLCPTAQGRLRACQTRQSNGSDTIQRHADCDTHTW